MNKILITLIVALFVVSCSSSDNDPVIQDPLATDVIAVGTITGFGSVIANGIKFDTDSATVTMNGQPGTLSDLRVGMMVTIRGTVQEQTRAAVASQIMFTDDAQGPISNMNTVTNSFVVLGRKVMFDEMTVFDGAPMEALADGNMVQVSGQWRSQERIQATHIHRIANAYAPGMTMEVKGQVSELNVATQQFRIGSQVCDYSAASLELGDATLANGLYVEVSSSSALSNGDMILDRIQAKDRDRDRDQLCDSDCDFEIEGYVTSFTSATEFEVDGQPVTTTDATTYVNGTVDSLALDIKLAINGTIDSAGVLIADRIVFRLPSVVEIEASVEAVDTQLMAVKLLGIQVATDEFTLFKDHSSIGITDFGFDDLAVGDRTEVRAYIDETDVVASRLERDDADDGVTLKAPVDVIARPDLTLLGVLVTTNQNTVYQDKAMQVIDADAFFSLVVEGDLVKAEGTYDGSSILASKLFLRDCENGCL